jgi:protein arginine N-methyltransferase 1
MYSPAEFAAMLADEGRVSRFLEAIKKVVRPGDVVLELGTGPGFFAVAAARAGASHVYAVDPDELVELGPALATANGCADRVTFIRAMSDRVALPRRADVLIEDMRGVLPFYGSRLAAIADANVRLLTPEARRIPSADALWAAPCVCPPGLARDGLLHSEVIGEIAIGPLTSRLVDTWYRAALDPGHLLAEPQRLIEINYAAPAASYRGDVQFVCSRPGVLAGWAVWFEMSLTRGVTLSTSPEARRPVYGQAFFPARRAVSVDAGARVSLDFVVTNANWDPVWSWESKVAGPGAPDLGPRQSTLSGELLGSARIRANAPSATANLGASRDVYRSLIELADGSRTNAEVAEALARRHPERFASPESAARFASMRLDILRSDSSLG